MKASRTTQDGPNSHRPTPQQPPRMTIQHLRQMHNAHTGHLFKQTSRRHREGKLWQLRYFILTSDATLHVFNDNLNPTATAVTSLPVQSCSGYHDACDQAFIITVQGSSVDSDGSLVNRVWMLRARNEAEFVSWITRVNQILFRDRGPPVRSARKASLGSSSASVQQSGVELSVRKGKTHSPAVVTKAQYEIISSIFA
ncbi:hypothetical protein BJ741DRAFT_603477 [Chytriomyces cf. hyalinus JEL632]|nr:hypothetical protein BJ741DRAFT_603477 [Chytriomyces cf. hyalinus JEL632]